MVQTTNTHHLLVHALVPGFDHLWAPLVRVERDDVGAIDVRKQIVGGTTVACMVVVIIVCVFAAVMTVIIVVRHCDLVEHRPTSSTK